MSLCTPDMVILWKVHVKQYSNPSASMRFLALKRVKNHLLWCFQIVFDMFGARFLAAG